MRKLIYIVLLFVSHVAFGQADVWTTRPVTNTGANFNKQSNHMANTTFDFTLRIPRSTHFTLNGGKDTLGAIAYALDVHKMGVYRGSGVWDTLNNAGSSITQTQVLHLADSLLSKLNVGDSTKYATRYYLQQNYVPYTGAITNININTKTITGYNGSGGGGNIPGDNWSVNVNPTFGNMFFVSDGAASGTPSSAIHFNNGDPSEAILEYFPIGFGDTRLHLNNEKLAYLSDIPGSGNFMDLTTNQSAAGNKRFTGQIQATGGVSPDGMGAINVTMNSTSPYAYYGMTRSGIVALAMGIDNSNNYIWGTGPTRGNGSTIDTVLMTLNSHMGDLSVIGNFTSAKLARFANFYSTSSAPTFALGGSTIVGTGASMSVSGTNQDGEITLTTGTTVSASGVLFTITLNGFAYPTKCTPVLTPEIDASTTRFTVGSLTNNSFTYSSNGTNLSSSTTYKFTYHNGGY